MLRLFKRKPEVTIISKENAQSFIQSMLKLSSIPGSNIKGVKVTRNGEDQIINLRVVSSDSEMKFLRKILERDRLFSINRRF